MTTTNATLSHKASRTKYVKVDLGLKDVTWNEIHPLGTELRVRIVGGRKFHLKKAAHPDHLRRIAKTMPSLVNVPLLLPVIEGPTIERIRNNDGGRSTSTDSVLPQDRTALARSLPTDAKRVCHHHLRLPRLQKQMKEK